LPHAESPPENAADTVAPENQSQSGLVLRKIQDMLRNGEITPAMEESLGMSKEELNQFVTKFQKAPKAEPGPGREIEVTPGKAAPTIDPKRSLPDLNPQASVSTKQMRDKGMVVQDNVRGNSEGMRIEPPSELKAGFNAYRSTLSKSKAVSPARRPPAADPAAAPAVK
jgi:hypothetical protein